MTPGVRARIRLGAIKHNLELTRNVARGARVMAVLKANAYGHGLVRVATALADADCLAVARLSEARILRRAGIDVPIVLLSGVVSSRELPEALALDLQLCIHCGEQIAWLEKPVHGSVDVWLKIDTGMNRLGLRPGDTAKALSRLRSCATVNEIRLMTHLANADDTNDRTTSKQVESFARVVDGFTGEISIANSAGIFGWPEINDVFAKPLLEGRMWARPGLALFGISPLQGHRATEIGLRPAMQFESQLIAVKPLNVGERVGYGGTWQAGADTSIGVVSAGYGDGYTRYIPPGSPLLINGRRVQLVGRISMDISTVELGSDADEQIGDTVVLWGDRLPVEEIAQHAETIPYTLVSGVSERVERIYED